jgi:hypothetical protein
MNNNFVYKGMEIRSAVMGIPVTITKRPIAKACRVSSKGFFKWDVTSDDILLESYVNLFGKGNPKAKTAENGDLSQIVVEIHCKLLLSKRWRR